MTRRAARDPVARDPVAWGPVAWSPVAGICLALLALAGCAETDPYARAGMWQPTGANSRNLAAMVANPYDLQRGRGERGNSGWESAPPVSRLWAGKPVPLPASGSQQAPAGPANTAPPGAN